MSNANTSNLIRTCWNRIYAAIESIKTPRRTTKVYMLDSDFSDDVAVALTIPASDQTKSNSPSPLNETERTNGS